MIRCVTVLDEQGNTRTTLSLPRDVVQRMNEFEDNFGEQVGAERRDRLLSALAAMVIQSLDSFRVSDFFKFPPIDGSKATLIEGTSNDIQDNS